MKSRSIIISILLILMLSACSQSLPTHQQTPSNKDVSIPELPPPTPFSTSTITRTPFSPKHPTAICSPAPVPTAEQNQDRYLSELLRISTITSDFEVYSLTLSPNDDILAWGEGSNIYLWNLNENQLLRMLEGHTGTISYLEFSPDGKLLASGGGYPDASVRLWDVSSGNQLFVFEGQPQRVTNITFDVDGAVIAFGGEDGTVRVWDVGTGEFHNSYAGSSVAFSADGQKMALGQKNGEVRLLDLSNDQLPHVFKEGHTGEITSVAFADHDRILAATSGLHLRLWDTASGELLHKFWGQFIGWMLDFDFNVNDDVVAFAGKEKYVYLSNFVTGELIDVLPDIGTRVAFSSDGRKLVVAGGWDNPITIWVVQED